MNWAENCAFLGYYAASSGNFLPKFQGNVSAPYDSKAGLNPEDGAYR